MFRWRVPKSTIGTLRRNGFAIVDNALPPAIALELRDEIVTAAMTQPALLSRNSTIVKTSAAPPMLIAKPNIGELDLSFGVISAALPRLGQFAEDGGLIAQLSCNDDGDSSNLADNRLPFVLATQTVKAQINFGGGACFPMHVDSDGDGRVVTGVVYLNETYVNCKQDHNNDNSGNNNNKSSNNSSTDDGGALRLYPLPLQTPIDVPPIFNRLVLFSSLQMPHRVLPSSAPDRICFTIWMSTTPPPPLPPTLTPPSADINNPRWLKLHRLKLAKILYANEWAQSIVESHTAADDSFAQRHHVSLLLSTHTHDVAVSRRVLARNVPRLARIGDSGVSDLDAAKIVWDWIRDTAVKDANDAQSCWF
ncbi:hypothetical protein HK100_008438 [Physocladia obscura]|uniref:Prolyl 4-hydroxylase alpha subunit domain-containing protein n=1 Tax=Physocladia obscura TaxID=109957 RepID=A0AAD5XL13_9FUNG|nr:hypothetical protein HK100_008438 [Physocladia obscura]